MEDLITILKEYEEDYKEYLDTISIYPDTTYSRRYLYIVKDLDLNKTIIGSANSRMISQHLGLEGDYEILHEIDEPIEDENEIIELYNYINTTII